MFYRVLYSECGHFIQFLVSRTLSLVGFSLLDVRVAGSCIAKGLSLLFDLCCLSKMILSSWDPFCRMYSRTPDSHLLDAVAFLSPSCDNPKYLQTLPNPCGYPDETLQPRGRHGSQTLEAQPLPISRCSAGPGDF